MILNVKRKYVTFYLPTKTLLEINQTSWDLRCPVISFIHVHKQWTTNTLRQSHPGLKQEKRNFLKEIHRLVLETQHWRSQFSNAKYLSLALFPPGANKYDWNRLTPEWLLPSPRFMANFKKRYFLSDRLVLFQTWLLPAVLKHYSVMNGD